MGLHHHNKLPDRKLQRNPRHAGGTRKSIPQPSRCGRRRGRPTPDQPDGNRMVLYRPGTHGAVLCGFHILSDGV